MQIERIPSDGPHGEIFLYTYEPIDIHPTTHVFSRYECGGCGGCGIEIHYLYLCNSADDFITALTPLGHSVKDSNNRDDDEYAKRTLKEFFQELKLLEKEWGGIIPENEIYSLIEELDNHVSLATIGSDISSASIGARGTISTYFDDESNLNEAKAMLRLYCNDDNWKDVNSPEVTRVKARLEENDIFILPGDEDIIALTVNLFNKGAYEWIDVVEPV